MQEESTIKPKAGAVVGIDKPFSAKEAKATAGVDSETRLFEGVHPDTSERLSVTYEGLQAEFGEELGAKKYRAIAGIAGGSVFFNPNTEATTFHPPLGIAGLRASLEELTADMTPDMGAARAAKKAAEKFEANQKHAAEVARILAERE